MCLKNVSNKKIAKKDIIVYKHLRKEDDMSPYFWFLYQKNVLYKSEIQHSLNERVISKGLHSYRSYIGAFFSKFFDSDKNGLKIVKMVIPKGSIYYTGYFVNFRSIVSNQIIWK